jgi:hypothetical protein
MGLVLFFANARAQTTCATAIPFTGGQLARNIETQIQNTQWFTFTTQSTTVKVSLQNIWNKTGDKVNQISFWSGTCGTLTRLGIDSLGTNDSLLVINLDSLNTSTVYYLQVEKNTNVDTIKYFTNLNYFLLSCPYNTYPTCDFISNGSFEIRSGVPQTSASIMGQTIQLACGWELPLETSPEYFTSDSPITPLMSSVYVPDNLCGRRQAIQEMLTQDLLRRNTIRIIMNMSRRNCIVN